MPSPDDRSRVYLHGRQRPSVSIGQLLQVYLISHVMLRSVTDGVDRLYGTKLSAMLSIIAILVAALAVTFCFNQTLVHKRIYRTLLYLGVFLLTCAVSFAYNATVADTIRNYDDAWVVSTRYLYYFAMFCLCATAYRTPHFVRNIHIAYGLLLACTSIIAVLQYFVGDVSSASAYENFERVWGFSAHPVLLSTEFVLMLSVYELSRRKLGWRVNYFDLIIYTLTMAGLVVAVSKTGVVILGMVVGAFIAIRRPILIPIFVVLAVGFIMFSPFEEHFAELTSIPAFIADGDYKTWDYRTAVTSFHWRLTHWYYLFTEALDRPWLGYGPGQVVSYNSLHLDAHSQFLQIFFDQGIVGLATYVVYWFSLPFTVNFAFRRSAGPLPRWNREAEIRDIWIILFFAVTFASAFSFGFSLATLAYTHFIVCLFVVLVDERGNNAVSLERLSGIRAHN